MQAVARGRAGDFLTTVGFATLAVCRGVVTRAGLGATAAAAASTTGTTAGTTAGLREPRCRPSPPAATPTGAAAGESRRRRDRRRFTTAPARPGQPGGGGLGQRIRAAKAPAGPCDRGDGGHGLQGEDEGEGGRDDAATARREFHARSIGACTHRLDAPDVTRYPGSRSGSRCGLVWSGVVRGSTRLGPAESGSAAVGARRGRQPPVPAASSSVLRSAASNARRPRPLAREHVRRLLELLVGLRVGHERGRARPDLGAVTLERRAVPEDVEVEPDVRCLVQPMGVKGDGGRTRSGSAQPASPDTQLEALMPATFRRPSRPGKSVGVAGGGVDETSPQPLTASATTTEREERPPGVVPSGNRNGRRVTVSCPEASTATRRPPTGGQAPGRVRPTRWRISSNREASGSPRA